MGIPLHVSYLQFECALKAKGVTNSRALNLGTVQLWCAGFHCNEQYVRWREKEPSCPQPLFVLLIVQQNLKINRASFLSVLVVTLPKSNATKVSSVITRR